ncbi:MlaD family protein [Nocardia huaxiensis]|uniref:MlaD family protein n=1 Tax=Nocardia huaxiensis TaxID=2755382 RepID=UPI001E4324C0|nr:MlaD family protein [Nocardia huaxiensis]UFS98543.1 MCE family protein [Nocardia huaxiensis]
MKSTAGLLLRLGVFAATMVTLLAVVHQAIQRPLGERADTYSAVFTDANGLHSGDDVRLFGVRVGEVSDLSIHGTAARVKFTVAREYSLYDNTMLAIRYQNLTGKRYLDIQPAPTAANRIAAGATIGSDHTVPSFDITTLFKGLQPVLAELTPADLNQFATSMLGVIEGDGTGLGPALDAIEKIGQHVTDRQTVISTLVRNLALIADQLGGSSGNAMKALSRLTDLFVTLQEKLGGLVDFSLTIPPVLTPAIGLLRAIGLTGDPNPDLDSALRTAFPDPKQALDVLNRLPGLLQSLTALIPTPGSNVDLTCSKGAASAPQPLQMLIGGQRITLCNS